MFHRIIAFFSHTVFKRLVLAVTVLALYAICDTYVEFWLHDDIAFPEGTQAVLGGVLSVLLVFRTNSCYDRWWEARKLWGQLVNDSRNLAIKVRTQVKIPYAEQRRTLELIMSFPHALRDHLRGRKSPLGPEGIDHVPNYLARLMYERIQHWKETGAIDGYLQLTLDRHAAAWMDICGACERIRNTPLPLSHRALIPQILLVYMLVLPVSLPDNIWSVLVTCVIGYFMLGLEFIAEELEEPFGVDSDDLPLEQFCAGIDRTIKETMRGEEHPTDSSTSLERPVAALPV